MSSAKYFQYLDKSKIGSLVKGYLCPKQQNFGLGQIQGIFTDGKINEHFCLCWDSKYCGKWRKYWLPQ